MNKKVLVILLVLALSAIALTGCGEFIDESEIASKNVSKEADNFRVLRKVIVINNETDKVLLEFEGFASIERSDKNYLVVTYRIGKGQYAKDFIRVNDHTTALVTQVDASNVDPYHYSWTYRSGGSWIPIKPVDMDKKGEKNGN